MNDISYIFFGTSEFSVYVLENLSATYKPSAVVTFPDKPKGRKLILSPNPVKLWAVLNNIEVIEVVSFKNEDVLNKLSLINADVFVVASFGKILPDSIIYMPKFKTLNVHPSLLPKLRGPAPIQDAILKEDEMGVSIMRLNEKMDEGPILIQEKVVLEKWPIGYRKAEKILGEFGGTLLSKVLPKWIAGEIKELEQNHNDATYTKKILKSDADITDDDPETAFRKVLAYEVWPRARLGELIITKAHIDNDKLIIDNVIPPGKKEILYSEYLKTK